MEGASATRPTTVADDAAPAASVVEVPVVAALAVEVEVLPAAEGGLVAPLNQREEGPAGLVWSPGGSLEDPPEGSFVFVPPLPRLLFELIRVRIRLFFRRAGHCPSRWLWSLVFRQKMHWKAPRVAVTCEWDKLH
jgi:hypothetical protein